MKLLDRYIELLIILKEHGDLTTKQIFSIACENTNSLIPNPEEASRMIYSLRGNKLVSSYDSGKTKMHTLTAAGKKRIEDYEKESQKTSKTQELDRTANTEKPAGAPADSPVTTETMETGESEQLAVGHLQEPSEPVQQDGDVSGIQAESSQSIMMIDIAHMTDEQLTFINNAVQLFNKPEIKPPVISKKHEKLSLLRFIESYHGHLNSDVAEILADIIVDIEHLESAA